MTGPALPAPSSPPANVTGGRRSWWPLVLGLGIALWAGAVVLGLATTDLVLVAPVVVLGSALVPATCTMAAFEIRARHSGTALTPGLLVAAFVPGGVSALLLSIVIDIWFARWPPGLLMPVVAVAETVAQLCIIVVLARRLPFHRTRDGLVLGAAVGFGFAAFETAGLAITSMLRPGASAALLLENIALRGVLAPFGHGLWAALVGAALFATAARVGRLRLSATVVGTVVLVAGLHMLWDLAPNVAAVIVASATGSPVTWQAFETAWIAQATVRQANLVTTVTIVQLVLIAAVGALLLRQVWRRAADDETTSPATTEAAPVAP